MQPGSLEALDGWIDRQKDSLSRPEAIRQLVERALGKAKRK
jgi:hypothetical protein